MENLLSKINQLYGLQIDFFEKVTKGFLSENYLLSDGQKKYFLKKYRFDNRERIIEIHSVKKYFADGGIPVILPMSTKNGETFFSFEDGYYALFPFVDEKQFERGQLSDTAIVSLGEMLGRIHLLGKKSILLIDNGFKLENKGKVLEKIRSIEIEIGKKHPLSEFDKVAFENVRLKKQLVFVNSITYEDLALPSDHLIHGDYLDHNVFFDKADKVSHVFDFEKTAYSPRSFELFRSMMYAFLSEGIDSTDITKAKMYLDSYLKIYPMSKDEIRRGLQLFYLKSIHVVWVESEHYLKNNYRIDEFLYSDAHRIKYLSENLEALEKALIG